MAVSFCCKTFPMSESFEIDPGGIEGRSKMTESTAYFDNGPVPILPSIPLLFPFQPLADA